MVDEPASPDPRVVKDAAIWRIGSQADVDWIDDQTDVSLTITSAIPPIFDAYATVVVPDDDATRRARDEAILALLTEYSSDQPWWLGYLDSGSSDIVFHETPKVGINPGWTYVLVEAGPTKAAAWRTESSSRGPLPELMFPSDHSWLLNTLWDDDWSCLGGPTQLIEAFLADEALETRAVVLGEDATPPGHVAH